MDFNRREAAREKRENERRSKTDEIIDHSAWISDDYEYFVYSEQSAEGLIMEVQVAGRLFKFFYWSDLLYKGTYLKRREDPELIVRSIVLHLAHLLTHNTWNGNKPAEQNAKYAINSVHCSKFIHNQIVSDKRYIEGIVCCDDEIVHKRILVFKEYWFGKKNRAVSQMFNNMFPGFAALDEKAASFATLLDTYKSKVDSALDSMNIAPDSSMRGIIGVTVFIGLTVVAVKTITCIVQNFFDFFKWGCYELFKLTVTFPYKASSQMSSWELTGCILSAVSMAAVGTTQNWGNILNTSRFVGSIVDGLASVLPEFTLYLVENIPSLKDYINTDSGLPAVATLTSEMMTFFSDKDIELKIVKDANVARQLDDLYNRAVEMNKSLLKMGKNVPPFIAQKFGQLLIKTEIAVKLLYGRSDLVNNRAVPVFCMLTGDPNQGKTAMTDFLLKCVYMLVSKEFPDELNYKGEYDHSKKWARTESSEYWEGYKQQWAILYSELFSKQEVPSRAVIAAELLNVVDSCVFTPNMAFDGKGKTFVTSELVIGTSNVLGNFSGVGLTSHSALCRRVAFPITVKRGEDLKDDCSNLEQAWTLSTPDLTRYPDYIGISKHLPKSGSYGVLTLAHAIANEMIERKRNKLTNKLENLSLDSILNFGKITTTSTIEVVKTEVILVDDKGKEKLSKSKDMEVEALSQMWAWWSSRDHSEDFADSVKDSFGENGEFPDRDALVGKSMYQSMNDSVSKLWKGIPTQEELRKSWQDQLLDETEKLVITGDMITAFKFEGMTTGQTIDYLEQIFNSEKFLNHGLGVGFSLEERFLYVESKMRQQAIFKTLDVDINIEAFEEWLYTTKVEIMDFYYTLGRYGQLTCSIISHGFKSLWEGFWKLDGWIRTVTVGVFGFSFGITGCFILGFSLGLIGKAIAMAISSFASKDEETSTWTPLTPESLSQYYEAQSQSDRKKPQKYRVNKKYRAWAGKEASSQMNSAVSRWRNVASNVRMAKFVNLVGWSVEGRILFGDSGQFVVSSHIPRSISNVKQIIIYDQFNSAVERIVSGDMFTIKYPDADRDFAHVKLNGVNINHVKDITKSFPNEHYKYANGSMQLFCDYDGNDWEYFFQDTGSMEFVGNSLVAGVSTEYGDVITQMKGYYRLETGKGQAGDCSKPVVTTDPRMQDRPILGIHVAREGAYDIVCPIFFSDWKTTPGLSQSLSVWHEEHFKDEMTQAPKGTSMYYDPVKPQISPAKTQYERSAISKDLPRDTDVHKPAHLMPFEDDAGNNISPLSNVFDKYDKFPHIGMHPNVESYASNIGEFTKEFFPGCTRMGFSMMTVAEACKGLDRTTSAGFPYVGTKLGKTSDWINEDFTPTQKLEDELTLLDARILSGELFAQTINASLKDEARDAVKVEMGKTRLFGVGGILERVYVKQVFGKFMDKLHERRSNSVIGVGIAAQRYSADLVRKQIYKFGAGNIVGGDLPSQDISTPTFIFNIMLKYFENLFGIYENSSGTHKENWLRLRAAIHMMANTVYIIGRRAYMCTKGNSSGNWMTTFVNTFTTFIYIKSAFLYLADFNDCELSFSDVWSGVIYGDDNIGSVFSECKEWFNNITIAEAVKLLFGITMTDPNKGEITDPFLAPDDQIFLSRKWLTRNGKTMCPLEKASLYKMLHWIKGKDNKEREQTLLQNLRQFEDELTMYPKPEAIKMQSEVAEACRKNGIPWNTRDMNKLQTIQWNQYNSSIVPEF